MTTSTAKLSGAPMGIAKYLSEEAISSVMGAANYYAEEGGQRPSKGASFAPDDIVFRADQIHGGGAGAMGWDLSLGLTMSAFSNVWEGKDPVTGEQLTKVGYRPIYEVDPTGERVRSIDPETGKVRTEAVHTAGIDIFFAAPKNVSIAAVVAARENPAKLAAIHRAHDEAVVETLTWIESTVALGRRTIATPTEAGERIVTKGPRKGEACKTQGSRSERVPVKLVFVSARQHTARPTEATMNRGAPPDMHLHSHNVALGIGFDTETGKHVVIDDYGLKTTAVERDARYMAALARNLEAAGIELEHGSFEQFEVSKNGRVPWRVRGITDEAIDHYSSNRQRAWDLVKDYEESTGRAATGAVLRDRMKGTRRSKDPLAKAMDSRPIYDLWHEDAERSGITMATPDLVRTLRQDPAPIEREPLDVRAEVLWKRLDSDKGFTMSSAAFDTASATTSLARCAEGLGFTAEQLADFETEMWVRLVHEPGSPERRPRFTTQRVLEQERYIDTELHARASRRGATPGAPTLVRAMADQSVTLDDEQRAAVLAASSRSRLSVWEGYAGTGKTTALKAVVKAQRDARLVDNVVVLSTAALTAKTSGEKLGADFSGSVEAAQVAVAKGRLAITSRTLVIFDEAAMCDTRRQVEFLKLTTHAKTILVGDPEQAQAIGAAGWYEDASSWLTKSQLTNVHRQTDQADVADLRQLRAGEAVDVVASLVARERFHVSDTHQDRLGDALADYATHREAGRSATDVRIIIDASNVAVDEANRQVQRYRRNHGEISAAGFEVESTDAGRRWTLHKGDEVLFLRSYGEGSRSVRNGAAGVIRSLDTAKGQAIVKLDDDAFVTVRLSPAESHQPLGLGYAVHTQKFQGSEVPVVLALPGSAGVTNKNTAYSTLSRCVDEVHVYADRETHGESPETTLARAWSRSPAQVSARSLMGEAMSPGNEQAAEANLGRGGAFRERQAEARHLRTISAIVGPEVTDQIRREPAYPALRERMGQLDKSGANTKAMIRTAVHERGLDGAKDKAAVLDFRLARMERIERTEDREMGHAVAPVMKNRPYLDGERFTALDDVRATQDRPTRTNDTADLAKETQEWQRAQRLDQAAERVASRDAQTRDRSLGIEF